MKNSKVEKHKILHFSSLSILLKELTDLQKKVFDQDISIVVGGDSKYGYTIECHWWRAMTPEEIEEYNRKSEETKRTARESRRQSYEKLKAEFEPEDKKED